MPLLPLLAAAALNTGDDLLAACVGEGPNKAACTAMVMGVANGAMLASQDAHQKILCILPGLTPQVLTEAGPEISRCASGNTLRVSVFADLSRA